MQGGPRRYGVLAITSAVLALSAPAAIAQTEPSGLDLGGTVGGLTEGQVPELPVLPETQGAVQDTLDQVLTPLRGEPAPSEPPPAPPPTPTPDPVPDPGDPDQGLGDSAGEAGSGGSDEASGDATGARRRTGGDERASRAGGAERGASVAPRPGDGAEPPGEGSRSTPENAEETPLREALTKVIEALPQEVKVALVVLSLLLIASVVYGARTWRRLVAAERRASTDRLTALPNRTSAEETLTRMVALSRRTGRPLSAAIFDLDHFKAVNDEHGHPVGDAALRCVGRTARETIRGGDFVARFGGEEFLLLLPDTDEAGALAAAEKLRGRIAEIEVPGLPRGVTASFGVATHHRDASGAAELISRADTALYLAKDAGRDRVASAAETVPARLEVAV